MTDQMRATIKTYGQPAFLVCVLVLAIAGSGMSIAIKAFGIYLKKEPLPLKKSLDLLDEKGLGPYRVAAKQKIENKEIIKELGTEDYIQWILEDTEAAVRSSVRRVMLFITYYRLPDRVPHVPEECYTGGGYQKLTSDSVTFEINNAGLGRIQGKYLVFASTSANHWRKSSKFPVLYLFKVNGEYANSRDEARFTLNRNIRRKQSYFCKMELIFNQQIVAPGKEEAVSASEKRLRVVLPILEKEHWPDWER